MPKTKEKAPALWEQVFSPDEAYTPEEIAEKVKGSPRQVRRWMDEGRLPFTNLPKGRRILGRSIIDYLNGRTVER